MSHGANEGGASFGLKRGISGVGGRVAWFTRSWKGSLTTKRQQGDLEQRDVKGGSKEESSRGQQVVRVAALTNAANANHGALGPWTGGHMRWRRTFAVQERGLAGEKQLKDTSLPKQRG
jgi:hypothetical protein